MINKYGMIIVLLLLTLGCSQQEPLPESTTAGLVIDVQVEHVRSRAVVTGTSMPSGSAIAVVVKNSQATETNYTTDGTKIFFTFDGNVWTKSTSLNLTQQGTVIAYYPKDLTSPVINANYTALTPEYKTTLDCGIVSSSTITLDGKSIYVHADEIDYLVGSGTSVSASVVRSRITLRHAMSMVAVRLIKGSTYGLTASLTKLNVESKTTGSLCTGTVSIPANEFTPNSIAATYQRTCTYIAQPIDQPGVYLGFLAYPAVLYNNALCTLTLTVDGAEKTLDLPGSLNGSLDWKAGNCILYDVTINGTKVEITNVSIAKWEDGSSGNMEVN